MNITTKTRLGTVKILMLKGEKGDTGASGDYAELINRPSINNVELNGNKTSSDLGLATPADISELQSDVASLETEVALKADASDVVTLQSDVTSIQTEVSTHDTEIATLTDGFAQIQMISTGGGPDNIVTSIPSGSNTVVGTYTLEAGIYIVSVSVRFNSNATGRRVLDVRNHGSTSSLGAICADQSNAVNGAMTSCKSVFGHTVTETSTFDIIAYQNSGGDLTVAPRIMIVKIK